MEIDRKNYLILEALQGDGRLSNKELAQRVCLSESATLRRVKLLEDTGVIEGYFARINPSLVGKTGIVFAEISLVSQKQEQLDIFEEAVKEVPAVIECYLLAGEFDYLLSLVVRDSADYERIHHDQLTKLPGVARVKSNFTLRKVVKKSTLPL